MRTQPRSRRRFGAGNGASCRQTADRPCPGGPVGFDFAEDVHRTGNPTVRRIRGYHRFRRFRRCAGGEKGLHRRSAGTLQPKHVPLQRQALFLGAQAGGPGIQPGGSRTRENRRGQLFQKPRVPDPFRQLRASTEFRGGGEGAGPLSGQHPFRFRRFSGPRIPQGNCPGRAG